MEVDENWGLSHQAEVKGGGSQITKAKSHRNYVLLVGPVSGISLAVIETCPTNDCILRHLELEIDLGCGLCRIS